MKAKSIVWLQSATLNHIQLKISHLPKCRVQGGAFWPAGSPFVLERTKGNANGKLHRSFVVCSLNVLRVCFNQYGRHTARRTVEKEAYIHRSLKVGEYRTPGKASRWAGDGSRLQSSHCVRSSQAGVGDAGWLRSVSIGWRGRARGGPLSAGRVSGWDGIRMWGSMKEMFVLLEF